MKKQIKGLFALLALLVFAGFGYASVPSVKEKAPPVKASYVASLDTKINFFVFDFADFDCQKFEYRQLVSWHVNNDINPVHYGLLKYSSKSHLINNERCSLPQINRCTNTK